MLLCHREGPEELEFFELESDRVASLQRMNERLGFLINDFMSPKALISQTSFQSQLLRALSCNAFRKACVRELLSVPRIDPS